jgi:hypothetical protein
MGKGSYRRPTLVGQDKYKDNWEAIFNKEKEDEQAEEDAQLELDLFPDDNDPED